MEVTVLKGRSADVRRFADGVIAYEGQWMGGETFLSFDKRAVDLLAQQGQSAVLLGATGA